MAVRIESPVLSVLYGSPAARGHEWRNQVDEFRDSKTNEVGKSTRLGDTNEIKG
jgi:hypothetical protein